jgi:hypothetical protein
MRNHRNIFLVALTVLFSLLWGAHCASAQVSPEEAQQLKKNLTPFGAERAGNKEGTIPEWTGGITAPPPGLGYKGPGTRYPDPYAEDKVLFSITAKNLDQYADKLNEGQIALLKKYPDTYRLDVYPTHRTQAAPQWVYDNTFANATRAEVSKDGNKLLQSFGGIPFPIPKQGSELIWNHLLRWQGEFRDFTFSLFLVQPSGSVSHVYAGFNRSYHAYYDKELTIKTFDPDKFYFQYIDFDYPPRVKGEMIVYYDSLDLNKNRTAWQYFPGQRRVRRAPSISFDNPQPQHSIATWDQIYGFNGSPERYNWEIIGKKEMYIPYNCYKIHESKQNPTDVYKGGHPNPDFVRWELHRVWVLEAKLKEGQRHIYPRRVFYLDEDSYLIALTDLYDGEDKLYRSQVVTSLNMYDLPGVGKIEEYGWDLQTWQYTAFESYILQDEFSKYGEWPAGQIDFFTPENLRRKATR